MNKRTKGTGKENQSLVLNEMQYMNKMMLLCYGITIAVLLLAYVLELVKGSRTVGYTMVFCMILIIPLILSLIMYKKMPDSTSMKYVAIYGYGVLYAFVLWTSTSELSFVYIFPILVGLAVYQNGGFEIGRASCRERESSPG